MSDREAPLNRAQEELTERVSWARGYGQRANISTGSLDAFNNPSRNSRSRHWFVGLNVSDKQMNFSWISSYQDTNGGLEPGTKPYPQTDKEENDERDGKISTRGELWVWFLAMKSARGISRIPRASQWVWPGSYKKCLKGTYSVTQGSNDQMHCLASEMVQRGPLYRFKVFPRDIRSVPISIQTQCPGGHLVRVDI